MALKINYIDNGIGIEIVASGRVTGDDILEAHQEIYSIDNLKRQKYQIIDRTECTEYQVSMEDIKKIAEIDNSVSMSNPDLIFCIIAPTDVQFGMSRAWEAYVEESKFKTQVFRDKITAESWLKEQLNKT